LDLWVCRDAPQWLARFAARRQWQDSPQAQPGSSSSRSQAPTFVIIEGRAGAQFWRTLDDAFFDRILPPAAALLLTRRKRRLPTFAGQCRCGVYEASDEPLSRCRAENSGRRLYVAATTMADRLSGSEGACSLRARRYWGAENAISMP